MADATQAIELRIPGEFGYEKMAVKLVGAVAEKMGFACERVEELTTAVSKACLNAIEHVNQRNTSARVLVLFSSGDDRLRIDVSDKAGFVEPEQDDGNSFRMVIYVSKKDQDPVTPAGQSDCH